MARIPKRTIVFAAPAARVAWRLSPVTTRLIARTAGRLTTLMTLRAPPDGSSVSHRRRRLVMVPSLWSHEPAATASSPAQCCPLERAYACAP